MASQFFQEHTSTRELKVNRAVWVNREGKVRRSTVLTQSEPYSNEESLETPDWSECGNSSLLMVLISMMRMSLRHLHLTPHQNGKKNIQNSKRFHKNELVLLQTDKLRSVVGDVMLW